MEVANRADGRSEQVARSAPRSASRLAGRAVGAWPQLVHVLGALD
jgi:hypothetical protein